MQADIQPLTISPLSIPGGPGEYNKGEKFKQNSLGVEEVNGGF